MNEYERAEMQARLQRMRDAPGPYSLGKRCTLCGAPVLNSMKVLTCQKCRSRQEEATRKG